LILAARFGRNRPYFGKALEISVITAVVLGGVDINGGKGTMLGAVLSLLLIGLMRFGMGLLNIQGQVQGIVIGLLLVLSILLPGVAGQVSASRRTQIQWRSVLISLGVLAVFIAFFLFFFWSRAPVIAGG
jgi:rhamnose transport system permease protein